ncbi:hypothetical protein PGT21_004000 [Puccinia graminis f. sp. tritici]|uniref:Uncharacterized protein n=1 Tax=Puccinia graminis f. sp. tritici TaxID=56615 RepID=A0A5B0NXF3_PUCGR|nr:hypothetical protein PGTUg99_007499 [Puccinia graminis f. sp. tritici]KAA1089024.1 hypothetical protein PGT21_004458 [Puccinia graminis f. sp. tritici]KAA1092468.1 hypothetical protein PGT21_004000 [Puccinia graminis f. sp. tritici]KAA1105163.1 hypothetical protein PGTUg99_020352 [Puccinia graminis f. sp. tritici]
MPTWSTDEAHQRLIKGGCPNFTPKAVTSGKTEDPTRLNSGRAAAKRASAGGDSPVYAVATA